MLSHSVVSGCLRLHRLLAVRLLSVHGILQARILEWVAIFFFPQGIFLTQGSNLGLLLHYRQVIYC